jgi:hypothetical protein
VRRWTRFTPGRPAERKDREAHLARASLLMTTKMADTIPDMKGKVEQVRVNGEPELLFEITVLATDEDDARKRALYRFERVLTTRIPTGPRQSVTLRPPWGKLEVDKQS